MSRPRKVEIVFWGGNINSVYKAFKVVSEKLNRELSSAFEVHVVDSPPLEGEVVVFPGVGNFGAAVSILKEKKLFDPLRRHAVKSASGERGFIGICLGYQILFEGSEEALSSEGLSVLPGKVVKFRNVKKVPHMGWNQVFPVKVKNFKDRVGLLWDGIPSGTNFYFVHSYHAPMGEHTVAVTDYDEETFSSASMKGLLLGVQFHPEKSQFAGLKFIENFLRLFLRM